MSQKQIEKVIKQLEDHEKRISLLEKGKAKDLPKKKSFDETSKRYKGKGEDLTSPIQTLVQNGFFSEVRIDLEVVSELQRKLLTRKKPLRASVVNVMRKMVRRGVLERTEIVKYKKSFIGYIKSSNHELTS